MKIKIIHCADLHFDTPFQGLSSPDMAAIRKEDLRQVFGRIISLVREENAHALVISGDLFDQNAVSRLTVSYLLEKLGEIPEVKVLIAAGNHDPKTPNSYYNLIEWGENVHIFDTTMEKLSLPHFDAYGISFSENQQETSLLSDFSAEESRPISIGIMHGDLGGSSYNPITKEEVKNSGLDYLALGHVHTYSGPLAIGNTVCAYPGCPEGRGFDELGEKGVIVAEIQKGNTQLRFVPLCKRKYHEIPIDITDLTNYESICGKIIAQINGSHEDLYKIILTGESDFPIQAGIILDSLDYFMVKIVDKTTVREDLSALAQELSLKGLFVKNMLEKIESQPDNALCQQALNIGLDALSGEKVRIY